MRLSLFPPALSSATVGPSPAPLSQERLARLLQQNASDTWASPRLKSDPLQCQGALKRLLNSPKQCLKLRCQYGCQDNVFTRLKMQHWICLDLFLRFIPVKYCFLCEKPPLFTLALTPGWYKPSGQKYENNWLVQTLFLNAGLWCWHTLVIALMRSNLIKPVDQLFLSGQELWYVCS